MTQKFLRDDGVFAALASAGSSTSGPPTLLTKASTANVTVTSTSYIDGPSVAQGTSGTWFVTAGATANSTGQPIFQAKIWDGTTVIASCATGIYIASTYNTHISLSGVISNPVGNIRISFAKAAGLGTEANINVAFNNTGEAADLYITAVRIG